jgi:shikimate dehydrogenase
MISSKTRVCALFGDPVEHSVSPAMHNAAFAKAELDFIYLAFHIPEDDLGQAVEAARLLGFRGLNITIPHKVNVMSHLDEIDPLAEQIGAVNTIVNNDGILKGYNTDATGFLRALTDKSVNPSGKNIVVLGAGGASHAVSFILARGGARLTILNRKEELDWAVSLAGYISEHFDTGVKAMELNGTNLKASLYDAVILVNTTSVGMSPCQEQTPVPSSLLRKDLVVFDIVYNPCRTRLMKDAEEAGATAIGGLDMLVCQGATGFEMWTGVEAPVAMMKEAAARALGL